MVDTSEHYIKVCDAGEWKPFVFRQDRVEEMDYIDVYQEIRTPSPCSDAEVFTLPDQGTFLMLACESSKDDAEQASPLYKWEKGEFVYYQNITTFGAQSWKFFSIDEELYLAVANRGQKSQVKSICTIYRWSANHKLFFQQQDIVTYTSRDIEYYEDNGEHYLAVANYAKDGHTQMASVIYRFEKRKSLFYPFKTVISMGAMDWTHFSIDGTGYLALANSFDGMTTQVYSAIYKLENGRPIEMQRIETIGAVDWEFFTVKDDVYLAVANSYNYGPQNKQNMAPYFLNSSIYKFNKEQGMFEKYQDILTRSATDWESFKVGDSTYLIVSNAQKDEETPRYPGHSSVYRWQGAEKFVRVHSLETTASTDWEAFSTGGGTYLVYTSAKLSTAYILKVMLK
ncbi:PREDICTED: thrombospondin-type laminin G domain and EAR repeat-containing protein-like [Priapulus caudatus]|uniref:Thrombospondin-type laminin G domain and EAR repeat-containing protein-like n=1 Tax=Priapulus caudatus TaxID=37621 RepID=A0ABM1DV17_PRICU|nr:PREDICTED: thrombospondin-type laminin G domain and EAR repeat-containing protein-like [Priapulus caudatus]